MSGDRAPGAAGAAVRVSVVIATVGRPGKLRRTLEGFAELVPETPPFEVVVALDGPSPGSRELLADPPPVAVRVVEAPGGGPGATRNRGAEAARGELLVFLNDDTRPAPDLVAAHWRFQREAGPCLAVGRVEWDPEREVTPYMAWLAPAGPQFNFARLAPYGEIDWTACWSANLAVPRELFAAEPFDEALRLCGLEDGEFGYRHVRRGHVLRYLPDAVCYHDHRYDGPADFRGRGLASGRAARQVVRAHPRLLGRLVLRPAAAALVRTLALPLAGLRPDRGRSLRWAADLGRNYVAGLLAGPPPDRGAG